MQQQRLQEADQTEQDQWRVDGGSRHTMMQVLTTVRAATFSIIILYGCHASLVILIPLDFTPLQSPREHRVYLRSVFDDATSALLTWRVGPDRLLLVIYCASRHRTSQNHLHPFRASTR